MTYDTQEYHPEPRVAGIFASHFSPEWYLNIKGVASSMLSTIPISCSQDPVDSVRTVLARRRFDRSGRYLFVAANARDKVGIVDTKTGKLVKVVESGGKTPHPAAAPTSSIRNSDRSG